MSERTRGSARAWNVGCELDGVSKKGSGIAGGQRSQNTKVTRGYGVLFSGVYASWHIVKRRRYRGRSIERETAEVARGRGMLHSGLNA